MNRLARRLGTIITTAVIAAPFLALPATQADAAGVKITSQAFGMTWLDTSHPYPTVAFGTARIWDMGLSWRDLQPNAPTTDILGNPTSDGWDQTKLAKLDQVIQNFASHGVQVLITLGQTPDWDADMSTCSPYYQSTTYGVGTCAPKEWDINSPWAQYIRALATRYNGSNGHPKVSYFETWNETDLHNGYNGPEDRMALMQQTAQQVLRSVGAGQALLSPSVPLHDGSNGINYLNRFLGYPGGTSFDIMNFHLYSSIGTAKAGYGPEWTMNQLALARAVLAKHGVNGRPIWNTEVNVGNAPKGVTFTGIAGAAQIDRTYILNVESGVQRTIWYAADASPGWAGTLLVGKDYKTLTTAGIAERWLRGTLVNGTAYGCTRRTMATNKWRYTCKFHLASGRNMLALWTTGAKYIYQGPTGTKGYYTVTGARHYASHATKLTISNIPLFVYGSFKI